MNECGESEQTKKQTNKLSWKNKTNKLSWCFNTSLSIICRDV